jgi:hypothetical protein
MWSVVFAVALFSFSEASCAWWLSTAWVPINHDQGECMKRSIEAFSCGKAWGGHLERMKDTVNWRDTNAAVTIHCSPCGRGNSIAFIAVTADPGSAKRLRDQLFDHIKSGVPCE